MKKIIAIAALLIGSLGPLGCAAKLPIHPGAVSSYDSYAYDLLLVEQESINQAKAQFLAGKLPPAAHDPLNKAIAQYDFAQGAWMLYHGSAGGDPTALQQALNNLAASVQALQQFGVKQ